MTGTGRQRMAELLRCPDQFPSPGAVRPCPAKDMDEGAASAVATGPVQLETADGARGPLLAQATDPTPLAGCAVCRQTPEVGAGCVNAHVRICAGGAGKPASLPQQDVGDGCNAHPPCLGRRRCEAPYLAYPGPAHVAFDLGQLGAMAPELLTGPIGEAGPVAGEMTGDAGCCI